MFEEGPLRRWLRDREPLLKRMWSSKTVPKKVRCERDGLEFTPIIKTGYRTGPGGTLVPVPAIDCPRCDRRYILQPDGVWMSDRPLTILESEYHSPKVLEALGVKGVDAEIDRLKEEKKAEWRRRGYSENLIRMAEDLSTEWTLSMSSAFAPPELREAVIKHIYPKSLKVADRWLTRIGEAAKASRSLTSSV